ncbi:transmembrane protein 18 isoform X1 [Heteronotia binoei]|uniref:transmembrane protein 18 isoform X1 n=1 Tax=Heteronotia binoei TaxID=13085 RepID=UPI0029314F43|nr:transmembrane protein 18 isoform X1 [Heteronotia binoei]
MEPPGRVPVGVTRILTDTDWSEPWLIGLVFFHAACLCLTYLSFRHYRLQIGHFLTLMILVFCAEYINEAAAANWRLFSKHQYFDSRGMFISLIFSVPLLLNAIIIVVSANLSLYKHKHLIAVGHITCQYFALISRLHGFIKH